MSLGKRGPKDHWLFSEGHYKPAILTVESQVEELRPHPERLHQNLCGQGPGCVCVHVSVVYRVQGVCVYIYIFLQVLQVILTGNQGRKDILKSQDCLCPYSFYLWLR